MATATILIGHHAPPGKATLASVAAQLGEFLGLPDVFTLLHFVVIGLAVVPVARFVLTRDQAVEGLF